MNQSIGDVGGTPLTGEGSAGCARAPLWRIELPLILLCAALLYGHTLQVPLYLDDIPAISQKPAVLDLGLAFAELFKQRGLCTLTFAINYRLGGESLWGYHLVNIAIHLASSWLVLLLLRRVFIGERWLPLCGTLVFLAHPLQTQAVTYLVQRMTSLSALLFLLALYLFVRCRELLAAGVTFGDRRHLLQYGAALLAGALAPLAKENAVVLPLALLLFARFFPTDGERRWRPLLRYLAPFMVAPVAVAIGYFVLPLLAGKPMEALSRTSGLNSLAGNSPLHYLATQCSVLWIYIRLLLLPYGQALDHAYPVSQALVTIKSVAGGLGLGALLAVALRLRQREPAMAFAILWFFLTLAVESSILPLDPLFEHRLYLPMLAYAMLVCALLEKIPRTLLGGALAAILLVLLGVLTWRRNALWNDPIALYQDNLRVAPHNERVYFNLGQEYLYAGLPEDGERMVRESIDKNPAREFGYLSLKELYVEQGRLDEAIDMLNYGLGHAENKGAIYNALSSVYGSKGEIDRAIELLRKAIGFDPKSAAFRFNLAQLLVFKGAWGPVEANLRAALALDANHAEARTLLIDLLTDQGRLAEAEALKKERG